MSPDDIKEALQNFEAARVSVSRDIVDMAANTQSLIAMERTGEHLRDAQEAVRFSGVYDQDGNPIFERDWRLMLEAVDRIKGMISATQPKGSGAAINIGINNAGNGNGNGGSNGQGRSFEAMVRLAEQKRRLELSDGRIPGTIDGEIVEADRTDAGSTGIELDDPDDAGIDDQDIDEG